MKKTFIFTLLLSIFLVGCNNNFNVSKNNKVNPPEETVKKKITENTEAKDKDIIEVTGGYSYYIETNNSVAPYKKTALNRVCFEPAQMETINNGSLFCFSNTKEALNILNIKKIDNTCKEYWGTAKIKIKNLSNKNISKSKADPCVKNGDCEFNEAELVEVIKFYYENMPQCKK